MTSTGWPQKPSIRKGVKRLVPWIRDFHPLVPTTFMLALGLILFLNNPARGEKDHDFGKTREADFSALITNAGQKWLNKGMHLAKNGRKRQNRKKDYPSGNSSRSRSDLSPEEKARWNQQIEEWKNLPPEKQNELRRRNERWQSLPAEEKNIYKKRYQQWKRLSPEEQRAIRQKLDRWDSLPKSEQDQIRRKFGE